MNSSLPSIAQMPSARARGWTSSAALEQALHGAGLDAARHVFTRLYPESAAWAAAQADRAHSLGLQAGLLSGVLISVKDLYDIAGEVTMAGTRVFADGAPARADAPAIARLRAAGAVIVGKTNMTELAFSGLGINPHHGTPRNPFDAHTDRIPGGSSSGAAVSVALGLVAGAIGSDTGGSIRIPAAMCGLVGFKSSQHRVPIQGAASLSHSLDTVCAMARSVADVRVLDAVLSAAPLAVRARPARGLRLAVPQAWAETGLDDTVARAFERSLAQLARAGVDITTVDWPELDEIPTLHAPAGFSAIECWATHRHRLEGRLDELDPRVASRLRLGVSVTAADYLHMCARRADWIERISPKVAAFDAWLCPTVPTVAPELAPLLASEDAFMAANRTTLRNTFVANFMDGCSISLPMQQGDELPSGLMLSGLRGDDAALLSVAEAVAPVLAP